MFHRGIKLTCALSKGNFQPCPRMSRINSQTASARFLSPRFCSSDSEEESLDPTQRLLRSVLSYTPKTGRKWISETDVQKLCSYYRRSSSEQKLAFLRGLAEEGARDHGSVLEAAKNLVAAQEKGESAILQAESRLHQRLTPNYGDVFTFISKLSGGVKFLVDLRADLLEHISPSTDHKLKALNSTLKDMLSHWFSAGFLNLERVTWQSSCEMLEKVSEIEAVHPIRSWTDIKQRVGPYRRCFVFTHNSMPEEPVMVLHCALMMDIPESIQIALVMLEDDNIREPWYKDICLLNKIAALHILYYHMKDVSIGKTIVQFQGRRQSGSTEGLTNGEDPTQANAGIFYSISSAQKGLQGIDLGNILIKSAVTEVRKEFPDMEIFSTLSPIPGFREWLQSMINHQLRYPSDNELFAAEDLEKMRKARQSKAEGLAIVKGILATNSWSFSEELKDALKQPLMRICARYLLVERRRGYVLNPVANFHLRNGASVWRLNWMGDSSQRGLAASCGIMVNYKYNLDQTADNSRNYIMNKRIAASSQVLHLTKTTGDGVKLDSNL